MYDSFLPTGVSLEESMDLTTSLFLALNDVEGACESPICDFCLQKHIIAIEQTINQKEEEFHTLQHALNSLDAGCSSTETLNQSEVVEWEQAMKNGLNELKEIEEVQDLLQEDVDRLESAEKELKALIGEQWKEIEGFQLESSDMIEQISSFTTSVGRLQRDLDRLCTAFPLSDACYIWFDGPLGTINGLRLGRLPSQPVPWEEINAAWGWCAFLLSRLIEICSDNASVPWRPLPMGSFSRMTHSGQTAPLFRPQDGNPLGRIGWAGRQAQGACWFMNCLSHLAEDAQHAGLALPYIIDNDTIGGLSIRYTATKEAEWSTALKYLLTDLKQMTWWACKKKAR